MFMKRIIYLALFSTSLWICNNSYGQGTRVQLRIDDIQGESTLTGHTNEIEILSYSNGISSCIQGSSGSIKTTSCKPTASDLTVMTQMDRSTIQLQQALVSGKVIPTADLTYIKTGETSLEFYKIHIENVRVDAVQESGSNEKPTVSVSLSYSRIAWKYTMQDANTGGAGEVTTGGWDFAASKAFNYFQ